MMENFGEANANTAQKKTQIPAKSYGILVECIRNYSAAVSVAEFDKIEKQDVRN